MCSMREHPEHAPIAHLPEHRERPCFACSFIDHHEHIYSLADHREHYRTILFDNPIFDLFR